LLQQALLININLPSIRSRLLMMVGAGAVFRLILLLTAVFSLNSFRNDIRQISQSVERSLRPPLTSVDVNQSAFQGQLRGLKNILIGNSMQENFSKAQKELLSKRDSAAQQTTTSVAERAQRGVAAATESSATANEVALLAGRLREATLQFSV